VTQPWKRHVLIDGAWVRESDVLIDGVWVKESDTPAGKARQATDDAAIEVLRQTGETPRWQSFIQQYPDMS
jgi:hypothetical protein